MELKKEEYQELEFALLKAFPGQDSLEQMVRHQLDENLEAIAGKETLQTVVFNLIELDQIILIL